MNKPRTRKAHFCILDNEYRTWKLAWCQKTQRLLARRKHSGTTFEVSAWQLIWFIRLRGTVAGKPLRPDMEQLAFA